MPSEMPPEKISEAEAVHISSKEEDKRRVVTTEEELEGYYIVKAILREVVDLNRIEHRDTKSYFGILLDDNNRKPICRLHFNTPQKYIGFFDNEEKQEDRVPIDNLNKIYNYANRLKATIPFYEKKSEPI